MAVEATGRRARAASMCAFVAAVLVALVRPAVAGDAEARRLGEAYRAYDAGELDKAWQLVGGLDEARLVNDDHLRWLRGQVLLLRGEPARAQRDFAALVKSGSRFAPAAPWRVADCLWERGQRAAAAKAYAKLVASDGASSVADLGTARFRIAEARAGKNKKAAIAAYRALLLDYPSHPLVDEVTARLRKLGGEAAIQLSPTERIDRAAKLTAAHLWHEAVAELALIGGGGGVELQRRRDYWLGVTLFKMRRRYADAGRLLLDVYPHMGGVAAEAMFHGARALSRADKDDEAITWYRKVVASYPSSAYAQEAQYLSGWLEFNRGNYAAAIGPLEETLRRYPSSKWTDDSLWFLGMSHYLLGHWDDALRRLEQLGKRGGSLEGGKGRYWHARTLERRGDVDQAIDEYRGLVGRWPFAWYSLLARARLAEHGVKIGPFGDKTPKPSGPAIAQTVDATVATDPLIRAADELIVAGLGVDAGAELERGEKAFLGRHDRAKAFAVLLDRYRRAGNFNRPWMLAVTYGGNALDGPAEGDARVWWEHAYPKAYQELVEAHQTLGKNPDNYLYSIMRKESGYDPHVLSYADAQGLLQMIPATTERVARTLGLDYDPGRLYEPDFNVKTGAWYIGHLLAKFKGQIPLGAGSFNSGPRPVMKWLDKQGDRQMDELVELVSYTQTREYMKKVTENYARYVYLYERRVYDQPLVVDAKYKVDELTY